MEREQEMKLSEEGQIYLSDSGKFFYAIIYKKIISNLETGCLQASEDAVY